MRSSTTTARRTSVLGPIEAPFLTYGQRPTFHAAVALGARSRATMCYARHLGHPGLCWGEFDGPEATRFVHVADEPRGRPHPKLAAADTARPPTFCRSYAAATAASPNCPGLSSDEHLRRHAQALKRPSAATFADVYGPRTGCGAKNWP